MDQDQDQELDDLLDSALDDFEVKPVVKNPAASTSTKVTIEKTNLYVDDIDYEDRPPRNTASMFAGASKLLNKSSPADAQSKLGGSEEFNFTDDNMKMFEEIFNDEKTKDSMKQFKDMFNMFKNEEDEGKLMQNFQKVMSELTVDDDLDEDDTSDGEKLDFLKNFTSMMDKNGAKSSTLAAEDPESSASAKPESSEKKNPYAKILDDLNKNSEKVLKSNPAEFPFGADFLSSLNLGKNADGDDDNLDSASSFMMEPILNMLFSKDILYPSLKLMLDNYDAYINERRDKLSDAELKKCLDQKECIKEMCSIYEEQKESDSSEKRSENLKKILDLLEKCGMPPSELVPEVNPFEALSGQAKGAGCPIS